MGKAALLSILAFGLIGGVYTMSTQQGIADADARVADNQREVLARNAALAGKNRAEQALTEDFSAESFSGSYGGVRYETETATDGFSITLGGVTIPIVPPDQATILSVAFNEEDEPIYHVRADYEEVTVSSASSRVPDFLQFALLTEDDLPLGSTIDATVDGDEHNELNADIHSNGKIMNDGGGGSLHIEGFLTSSEENTLTGYTVNGAYVPHYLAGYEWADAPDEDGIYNPSGADVIQENVDPVPIPTFSASAFADSMRGTPDSEGAGLLGISDASSGDDVYLVEGNNATVDLTSAQNSGAPFLWRFDEKVKITQGLTIDVGERERPLIWHVDNLEASSGNIEFKGDIVLLSDNNINLHNGNFSVGNSNVQSGANSFAMFAENKVIIDGASAPIYGHILAGQGVELHGSMEFYGGITTKGAFNPAGGGYSIDFNYRPLEPSFWYQEQEEKVKVLAYNEW